MLGGLLILLVFQLGGEVVVRLLGLPVPGPVVGLVALLAAMVLREPLLAGVKPAADQLLKVLSLLFVPAGVGVVQYLALIGNEWLPIGAALLVGTGTTLMVTALVMRGVLARGEPTQ